MADRRYWPQLDGVRAVAIGLVVAYHLGYLDGGWIGVDVFFVLSGYLITNILLEGLTSSRLKTFWGHRARRLLPAVLVLLLVLALYAWLGGPGVVPAQLRAPALATLLYSANWQQIVAGHQYFSKYTSVSPLQQTWSLAVEEQYYLCWPPLLLATRWAARWWAKRRPRVTERRFLIRFTLGLALLSAVWMGIAVHLYGVDRGYLGTDTRAWELLLGGAFAMIWPPARISAAAASSRGRGRWRWPLLTGAGALAVAVGVSLASGPPGWLWDGGLVVIDLGVGLVIVGSIAAQRGVVARGLTLPPLRWLGIISYSLYLWHWPVIVLMTADTTGYSGAALLLWRLAAMVAASCASFYLIERPLRRADWGAVGRRLRLPPVGIATAGAVVTAAVILAGTVGPAPAGSAPVASEVSTGPRLPALDVTRSTPGDPYRVWVMGDSVMDDSSLGIIAALQATGAVSVVENSAFPGWGLTTYHPWRAQAQQLIAQHHPQLVIGTWSWDDQEAQSNPAAYRTELETYLATMLAPGDGVEVVALLQFPEIGPDNSIANLALRESTWLKSLELQDAWDTIAQQAVAAFPGHAVYLTTEQLFAPDGRFLAWMRTPQGTWVRARKLDDTHMCPYGAAQFGALLTRELTPTLHLPAMKSGWEYGKWTHDPRYNDPLGACPDDQPPAGYRGVPLPVVPAASRLQF